MVDEPAKGNLPQNGDVDSDATVVVGPRDDATTTRTVAAPAAPVPPAPPRQMPRQVPPQTPTGKPSAGPQSSVEGEVRPPTTASSDGDATVTRAAVAAPPRSPTAAVPPRSATAAPAAPTPADDSDATTTRSATHGPRPPTLDVAAMRASAQRAAPAAATSPVASAAGPKATEAPTLSANLDIPDDATVIRVAPRGRPRLILSGSDGGKREVPLTTPDVSIGRAKTCDVILPNAEVSRLHARIVARGPDHLLIPIGTRRNTYINGELVLEQRLLRHGDVIRLASEEVVYAQDERLPERLRQAVGDGPQRRGTSPLLFVAIGAVVAIAAVWFVWPSLLPQDSSRTPGPVTAGNAPVAPPAHARPDSAAAPAPPDTQEQNSRPIVAPPPQQAPPPALPDSHAEQISKLIYQGDIAFVEKKYTTPPDGSALYAYREALKLDPQNARARSQIALIIDRYLDLAEHALTASDRADARLYSDKAAYVHEQAPDVGDHGDIERRLDDIARRLGASRHK